MESLRFLNHSLIETIRAQYQTPIFIYSEAILREQARKVRAFPHHFGITTRYAMKANSNVNILKIFDEEGIHIDASSEYEVYRAMAVGISPSHIQLTGQEMPRDLKKIVHLGVEFNATSLHQLETYAKLFPGQDTSIRVNPGVGSGGTNRTNVGGPGSSFGIWHEELEVAKHIAKQYNLTITKLHTHIGSGSDPEIWKHVVNLVLTIAEQLEDVTIVSLGGGFKVGRMEYEKTADLQAIGIHVQDLFYGFYEKTGRKLHLEIEPGTFLVANSGSLVTEIIDIVNTGGGGYDFIKVNAGMTEITRPSLYGAQHPLIVCPRDTTSPSESKDYIVVGHNCESGDIFTPAPSDPEGLLPRTLAIANIGDSLVLEGVGAYCSSMSTHGYNSFPEAGELLLRRDGTIVEVRKRAEPNEIWRNEISVIE